MDSSSIGKFSPRGVSPCQACPGTEHTLKNMCELFAFGARVTRHGPCQSRNGLISHMSATRLLRRLLPMNLWSCNVVMYLYRNTHVHTKQTQHNKAVEVLKAKVEAGEEKIKAVDAEMEVLKGIREKQVCVFECVCVCARACSLAAGQY